MKLKDLNDNKSLVGVKVKTPDGKVGLWKSQWPRGVWLTNETNTRRVFPIFVEDLSAALEWEIVDEPTNLE